MRAPDLRSLSLGFSYEKNREEYFLVLFSYAYVFLFGLAVFLLHITAENLVLISFRYHFLVVLSILLPFMARRGLFRQARLVMLFLPPFLLVLLPSMAGLTGPESDEFYFWFPYMPIGLSLIPHFICNPRKDRILLWVTLLFYLLLSMFLDDYMIWLSDGTEEIMPLVLKHHFFYGLIPVIIFAFVNLTLALIISENHRYEELVLKQRDELVQTEKMASLGTLTAGIGHEINNPLNFISGGIHATRTLLEELFAEQGPDPERKDRLKEQLSRIMESTAQGVGRASDIVASLKFFSNPGSEKLARIKLEKLLYPVLLALEKDKLKISIIKEIPEGFQIACYEEPLQMVFGHVLDNASRALSEAAAPAKGSIRIRAEKVRDQQGAFSRVSFYNNGPMIPENALGQIFDPFFTSREEGDGKGLGMAISYMVIQEHKGRIEARNMDPGVEISILLPEH